MARGDGNAGFVEVSLLTELRRLSVPTGGPMEALVIEAGR